MRTFLLTMAVVVLVLSTGDVEGQSKSSSSGGAVAPPTEIGGKTLKQYIAEVKSRDPGLRENAIRTIPYFGERAGRDAVPALTDAIRDRDASCRVHACLALMPFVPGMTAQETDKAVNTLSLTLSQDAQGIVRYHAALTLAAFGQSGRPAIPALIQRMRDGTTSQVRKASVMALSTIAHDNTHGPESRALNAICSVFLDPNYSEESSEVRLEAAIALGAMGRPQLSDQPRAIQALQRALKDPDKAVNVWAYVSLMAVDKVTDDALNGLAKHLKGKDLNGKIQAARGLVAMGGSNAKKKIPELIAMLDDRDQFAVAAAVWALGELGPYASEAIPALTAIAEKKDQNETLRDLAREAIKKIHTKPKKDS